MLQVLGVSTLSGSTSRQRGSLIKTFSCFAQVSCIALNGAGSVLASGQTGPLSLVRLWGVESGRCLALFKTHSSGLHTLRYSHTPACCVSSSDTQVRGYCELLVLDPCHKFCSSQWIH